MNGSTSAYQNQTIGSAEASKPQPIQETLPMVSNMTIDMLENVKNNLIHIFYIIDGVEHPVPCNEEARSYEEAVRRVRDSAVEAFKLSEELRARFE